MSKIANFTKKAWGLVVWTFEKADIIPPLIIVSAWHYSGALAKVDPLPVAIALGILIDLGHYRSVKATIANNPWKRFAVMAVLTAMTGYYHWLWYRDLILAAAVPTLIICLSLLSKWGGWERQAIRIDAGIAVHDAAPMPHDAKDGLHQCAKCGARVHNIGSHVRWHCPARKDGKK